MKLILLNQSSVSMPRKWIGECLQFIYKELKKRKSITTAVSNKSVSIVFLESAQAKAINKKYRDKNYATDVLSFEGDDESLGELVMCPQVLGKQAKEHGHSFKAELGYMLIHGVLHLLGYDHDKSEKEAQLMFGIQDQVFDRLCDKFKL